MVAPRTPARHSSPTGADYLATARKAKAIQDATRVECPQHPGTGCGWPLISWDDAVALALEPADAPPIPAAAGIAA